MKYFNHKFIDFLTELESNNTYEWFKNNKPRFEEDLKNPFANFVSDLIHRVNQYDSTVLLKPNEAIFKMHFDVRFQKVRIPYKLFLAAIISPEGRKGKEKPGLYLQMSSKAYSLFGGLYSLEKDSLQKVREFIAGDLGAFQDLYHEDNFKSKYGSIVGEKNKRLNDSFIKENAQKEPYLFNKQLYYTAQLPAETILEDDLMDKTIEYYLAGKPLNDYFRQALEVN